MKDLPYSAKLWRGENIGEIGELHRIAKVLPLQIIRNARDYHKNVFTCIEYPSIVSVARLV